MLSGPGVLSCGSGSTTYSSFVLNGPVTNGTTHWICSLRNWQIILCALLGIGTSPLFLSAHGLFTLQHPVPFALWQPPPAGIVVTAQPHLQPVADEASRCRPPSRAMLPIKKAPQQHALQLRRPSVMREKRKSKTAERCSTSCAHSQPSGAVCRKRPPALSADLSVIPTTVGGAFSGCRWC